DSDVSVGTGLLIVKVTELEVPPPGGGLVTVTNAVPALAISAAVIAAVSVVLLTKVVARTEPFHCTVELFTKFVPLTVRVKSVPPAIWLSGEREITVGTRLFMVKVSALEVPPPGGGFKTVTAAVPALAMSLAGTVAVSC